MWKRPVFWLLQTAAVMLLLPLLAVRFVQADQGMAVVLLLFFGIDPVYSVLSGYYAGKQIRLLWWLPLVSGLLFLTGTWLCFEMGESAFFLYAAVYWLLGTAAMLLSRYLPKRRKHHG